VAELVTLTEAYQVTIPPGVAERLGLKPGTRLSADVVQGRVVLSPCPTLENLRGLARGINVEPIREDDDRL